MQNMQINPPPKEDKPLPMFRQDLKLYPGPSEPDGSPTYNLFDPVRGQYFRVSWTESLVFKFLKEGMTIPQLIKAIESHSTLKVTPEEITEMFQDAMRNNLLLVRKTSDAIAAEAEKQKTGVFKWLLYHYLYIRIPLINPDKFLTKTLKYVLPLWTWPAIVLYIVLFFLGTFQLVTRFDEFLHTFPYFFTIQGAVLYAVGISAVKIIHEFSHAYTAKYYKLFVPTMGVALIVFWPVLYTDVTDGWKLARRSQRLAISFAGIAAELILAGISTLLWSISSPGTLQSVFFIISSVTWISTLAVNLNPAMRFDGYYLLTDLWGIDNLQARTFATTRWQLRKWFLGIDVPPPEDYLTPQRKIGMIVYSIYTWVYRLFLYTAIAIFVYKQFTKVLGIFLFILEIAVFIIWPLASEAAQINRLRPYLTWNRRSILTATATLLLLLWVFLPLPHRESFTAITVVDSELSQVIYVPYDSVIKKIYIQREDHVKIDQPLVQLYSAPLFAEIAAGEVEKASAEREILIASQSEEDRAIIAEKLANVQALDAKIKGLERIKNELTIIADVNGTVYEWDKNLKENQSVMRDQVLGRIADLSALQVMAYIPETYINDLHVGDHVTFRRYRDQEKFSGTIININPVRTMVLQHPQLASVNHGDLPVAGQPPAGNQAAKPMEKPEEQMRLVESYYTALVALEPTDREINIGEKGDLDARTVWRSYFMTFMRFMGSLFWQEGTL